MSQCSVCGAYFAELDCPVCGRGPSPIIASVGKVGTELSKIIPKMFAADGCASCKRLAKRLDSWGSDRCEREFDRIVRRLVLRSRRKAFIRFFPNVCEQVAASWLRTAIDRSRVHASQEKFSAVWVYWPGGAEGDELRYSMRSASANIMDCKNIVLCGGKPDWYTGDFIRSRRFNKQDARAKFGIGTYAKFIDSIVKLRRIIDSPLVTDRFLWMYDDTFIVQPCTIDWLSIPRAGGTMSLPYLKRMQRRNSWRKAMYRTALALHNAGLPMRNFSTHYPVVYEKAQLLETIERFECDTRPRLIETLYLNQHSSLPAAVHHVFQYSKRIRSNWSIASHAVVVNVGGFKRPVAQAMANRFESPCAVEIQ